MTTRPCTRPGTAPNGCASMGKACFPSSAGDRASVPLTPLDQPRGEEPVQAADLFGRNGQAPHVRVTAQDSGDLGFALLGFERAYAIDNSAAWPRQRDR